MAMELLLFCGIFLGLVPGVVCEYKFSYGGIVAAIIAAILCLFGVVIMWMMIGLWPAYYHRLQLKQGRVLVSRPKRRKKSRSDNYSNFSTLTEQKRQLAMHDLTPRGEQKADVWAQAIPLNQYETKSKTMDLGDEEETRFVENVRLSETQNHAPQQTTRVYQASATSVKPEYRVSHQNVVSASEQTSYIVEQDDISARNEYRTSQYTVALPGEERTTHIVHGNDAHGKPNYRATHHDVVSTDDHTTYIKLKTEGDLRKTYAGTTTQSTSTAYPGPTLHSSSSGAYHVHATRISAFGEEEEVIISPTSLPLFDTDNDTQEQGVSEDEAIVIFTEENIESGRANTSRSSKDGDLVIL